MQFIRLNYPVDLSKTGELLRKMQEEDYLGLICDVHGSHQSSNLSYLLTKFTKVRRLVINFRPAGRVLDHIVKMDDFSYEFVNQLPNLEDLIIKYPPREAFGLTVNVKHPSLKVLDLRKVRADKIDLLSFSSVEDVRVSAFGGQDLTFLSPLKKIVKLNIGGCKLNSLRGLEAGGKTIKHFELHQAHSTLKTIEEVAKLTGVEELILADCPKIERVPELSSLGSLKSIVITNCGPFDKIEGLENLPLLKDVSIDSKKITNLDWLLENSSVEVLSINGSAKLKKTYAKFQWPLNLKYVNINHDVLRGDVNVLRACRGQEPADPIYLLKPVR